MNKLLGFYELKKSALPTIPWKEFTETTELEEDKLWTIRTAVYSENDTNLPRSVGKHACVSQQFAKEQLKKLKDTGIVIYYPYFNAEKSGNIILSKDNILIEAINGDLWNLTNGKTPDYRYNNGKVELGIDFLQDKELKELLYYTEKIKTMFPQIQRGNKSVIIEFSYAYNTNLKKENIGERYLVFYEIKEIN